MKKEKGILLVVLTIIIILLLILAVVTIIAISGNKRTAKEKNVKDGYQTVQGTENSILSDNAKGKIGNSGQTIDLNQSTNYVGYYADLDNDGTPDGVIFLDLMKSANGNQTTVNGKWNNDDDNTYSYTTIESSKVYTTTTTNYTGTNAKFGEHPIISVKSGSTGNDRFYVIALNDIDSNYYLWDTNYVSNNYSIGEDYIESSPTAQVAIQTSNGASVGKRNTSIVMQSTELTADTSNLWNHIGPKVSKGWFVPSRAEWSAFGDYMYTKLNCSTSNYSTFGLSSYYWSSSQFNPFCAWYANFDTGNSSISISNSKHNVRLAITF